MKQTHKYITPGLQNPLETRHTHTKDKRGTGERTIVEPFTLEQTVDESSFGRVAFQPESLKSL